jgi:hypothetical protein
MAAESADGNEMISTIRQVLKNCVLDEIDIDSLPTFDLEFLFMNLRARSVEEVVELNYKCNNRVKGEEGQEKTCNGVVNLKVNILEIEPTKNPKHEKKVQINDDLGIVFKYPTFEMFQKYEKMSESEVMINILVDCIDYIFDKEQVYYAKDTPKKELEDFVDNLQQKDLEKFKEFFDTMPEIKKDFHFKCPKCAYEEEITIKGMQSFFV